MFTQYFGNYLYEAGVLSSEQFKEALRQMKDKRARLGVLAIEAGFMTPSQVEETFSRQLQVDKKFGELAKESGYLTDAQLQKLLAGQSSPFAIFSQVMIDGGFMTYAELSSQLENYKKKCGLSAESFKKFQEGDISPVLETLLQAQYGDPRHNKLARAYVELFFRNVTRFVSDNAALGGKAAFGSKAASSVSGGWTACQQFRGTLNMTTWYTGSEAAMLYLAGRFAKADYTAFDALARDVAGEFLNCTNGIFTANALELGVDLDLDPQYVTNDFKSPQANDLLCIHFSIENHQYQLCLAF